MGRYASARNMSQSMKYTRQCALCCVVIILCAVLVGCGNSSEVTLSAQGKEVSQQAVVPEKTTGPVEPPDNLVVNKGQVEPPDPFIVKNHPVLYGRMIWPKWQVVKEFPIYQDKDEKSPVVTRLIPGDIVQTAGSELWTHPTRLLVTKDYISRDGRRFNKGDRVYALYRYEEGIYRVWQNGIVFYLGLYDVKGALYYEPGDGTWGELHEHPSVQSLWVYLISQNGEKGWTDFDGDNFETNPVKQPK